MEDYASNAKKKRERPPQEEKNIQQVTTDKVVVKKKPMGQRVKDLFIQADFRGVVRYVVADVMLPAARDMIVNAGTQAIQRTFYGESRTRPNLSNGPRVTYQTPVNRGFPNPGIRFGSGSGQAPRIAKARQEELVFNSRNDAEHVLETMLNIIDQFDVVSVGDFNSLVGMPSGFTDNRWGWGFLGDVEIRQTRDGYIIELPAAEPLN